MSMDLWHVFPCPECDGTLFITDGNLANGERELVCENGHGWLVGPAGNYDEESSE